MLMHMTPAQTGKNYDHIAAWWLDQMKDSRYGLDALERAIRFVDRCGSALDVGCGCEGRFLRTLQGRGFTCTGVDISETMIALARPRIAGVRFFVADICEWKLPERFDFIAAWDSLFHLPADAHLPVLTKLCDGLHPGGVMLFSGGGMVEDREVSGEMNGYRFEYSTPGVDGFTDCLRRCGCSLKHLEYDQVPQNHVYLIAQKN